MNPAERPFDDYTEGRIRLIMGLRKAGITDSRVLNAIENVPRELFVSEPFLDKAYDDTALPIEHDQTISQPTIVAWMTWALDVSDRHRVLEIGTGSGYQAAVLSKLCRRVYTIERHRPLLAQAEKRFQHLGIGNITTRADDGNKGWKEVAPFDRIIVTAAASEIPAALVEQLAMDGVMVVPVGTQDATQQILLRVTKTADGMHIQHMMPVRFVPLVAGIGA